MTDTIQDRLREIIGVIPYRNRNTPLEAADHIDRLEAQTQWQPIETAPRDGTLILCLYDDNSGVEAVQWLTSLSGEYESWYDMLNTDEASDSFSHWMPLPTPPEEAQ